MQEVQEVKDNADARLEDSRGTDKALTDAFNDGFMQALEQVAHDIDNLASLNKHKLTNYLCYLEMKSNLRNILRFNGYKKTCDISKDMSDYQEFLDSLVRGL